MIVSPFPVHSLFGYNVVVSQDVPRYTLPKEVLPGIPWPKGFRDSFNTWAEDFLGKINPLHPGEMYIIRGKTLYTHPQDFERLKKASKCVQ